MFSFFCSEVQTPADSSYTLWSQYQSLKTLMLHLSYGAVTKGSRCSQHPGDHPHSTAFNLDIPAESLPVPKKWLS